MQKIAFDLDDILATFQTGWLNFNNQKYGTNLKYTDFTEFNYTTTMGIDQKEVFKRIFEFYETPEFANLAPVEGAIGTVNSLVGKYELSVMTSRVLDLENITRRWLKQHFKKAFTHIYFSGQISKAGFNHNYTKADICQTEKIDVLVEDAPIYVDMVIQQTTTKVILVTKPWNSTYQENNQQVIRVGQISEILKHLI